MMFGIPIPAIVAALTLGAAIGGFLVGIDYEQGNQAESQVDYLREHNRYIAEQAQKINKLAMELEHEKTERKAQYENHAADMRRLYSRPVYSVTCLDADGVRVINRALAGETAGRGGTDAALP